MRISEQASPQSTPQNTQSPAGSVGPTDSWAMKSLNDLRSEMINGQERSEKLLEQISSSLQNTESRINALEARISRLLWVTSAVGATLIALWGGYELLSEFFHISVEIQSKD